MLDSRSLRSALRQRHLFISHTSYRSLGRAHLLVSTVAILIVFVIQQVSGKRSHRLDIASDNFIQVFKLLWANTVKEVFRVRDEETDPSIQLSVIYPAQQGWML